MKIVVVAAAIGNMARAIDHLDRMVQKTKRQGS
jgi:hypothetical protein